ncbi:MAG: hypothetical protein AAFV80_08360 [Bacteroidota bacterium]
MKPYIKITLLLAIILNGNVASLFAQKHQSKTTEWNLALAKDKDYRSLKATYKEHAVAFQKIESELKSLASMDYKSQAAALTQHLKGLEAKRLISKKSPLYQLASIPLTNDREINKQSMETLKVVIRKLKATPSTELEGIIQNKLEEGVSANNSDTGAILGGAIGTITGAVIGSLVPGLGSALGATIGNALGVLLGKFIANNFFNGDNDDDPDGEPGNNSDNNDSNNGGDSGNSGSGSGNLW